MNKYKAVKIVISWSTSPLFINPVEFTDKNHEIIWYNAEKYLKSLGTPKNNTSYSADFSIYFEDGECYNAEIELSADDDYQKLPRFLAKHILQYISAHTGRHIPEGETKESMAALMKFIGKERIDRMEYWWNNYDFTFSESGLLFKGYLQKDEKRGINRANKTEDAVKIGADLLEV